MDDNDGTLLAWWKTKDSTESFPRKATKKQGRIIFRKEIMVDCFVSGDWALDLVLWARSEGIRNNLCAWFQFFPQEDYWWTPAIVYVFSSASSRLE